MLTYEEWCYIMCCDFCLLLLLFQISRPISYSQTDAMAEIKQLATTAFIQNILPVKLSYILGTEYLEYNERDSKTFDGSRNGDFCTTKPRVEKMLKTFEFMCTSSI